MRILLADDHAIVREGLRRILTEVFEGVVVAEVANGAQAVEMVASAPWDLLILDISMPGRSGLEVIKDIHSLRRDLPVLMMTMYPEEQFALRALRAGAAGYLTKGSAPEELIDAVKKVVGGGRYVSAALGEHLATRLATDSGVALHDALSNRELQVLQMLASGKSVKEIGADLHLSDKTVSTYRTRVLDKMRMRTTAELMRYAIRAHLVD